VTATREKLLDMAACFEAMGHPVAACDAREAASKLAPSAPDDAGLSEERTELDESSARYLENVADEGYLDDTGPYLLRKIAAEIRAALANGAGEVERLRAELADARRWLAETELALEKKQGAFNFECSLRSTAERARLDAAKERDSLRAELAKTANERDGQTMRADAWKGSADSLRAELDEARAWRGARRSRI
jgi:hypothetical protein